MINKNLIINFVKRIYFPFWWRMHAIKSLFIKKKEKDQLIFVFGGRNEGWPTIGRGLYDKDADFRETIKSCNSILTELGGAEILSYFEQSVNECFFEDEAKFTCITAIQLATVKTFNRNGIFPNAVLGISMGEPVAAYAAGALTLREALTISLSYMTIFKLDVMEYVFLFLDLPFNKALEFCMDSPVWTEIIFEDSADAVLITCHKNDVEQLDSFLKSRQLPLKFVVDKTFIPYHTSKIKAHYQMLRSFQDTIQPKPLKCDYYSPTLGKMIPKYSVLDADYWFNLACLPVLFFTSLKLVTDTGYKTFLQIGPPGISDRQFNPVISSTINVLNSFQTDNDELNHLHQLNDILFKQNFEQSSVSHDDLTTLNNFLSSFNIQCADQAAFNYLRNNGPIHFLPFHHGWLLQNYNDVDHVLKQPELFSSSILKDYDPILLGADPQEHKVMRDLLHPLFSPEVISSLAQFTKSTAQNLLDLLCKHDRFDFVKDYSDPLSLLVLCNFFGLSSKDADKMLEFTGKDYHNKLYWQRLEEFFNDQFNTCKLTKEDCLWAKLRNLVTANQFVLTDAISLLKIVWTAGMATTSALISTSIYQTLNNQEFIDQMNNDDKLISKFIEECLRLHTPISAIYRITTQPVELYGLQIPSNTTLILHLKSAMADPEQYISPSQFSISRPAKRHLAFGAGIHQCIGMGIARAEARSALQVVLSKIADLQTYTFAEPEYVKVSDLETMTSLRLFKE